MDAIRINTCVHKCIWVHWRHIKDLKDLLSIRWEWKGNTLGTHWGRIRDARIGCCVYVCLTFRLQNVAITELVSLWKVMIASCFLVLWKLTTRQFMSPCVDTKRDFSLLQLRPQFAVRHFSGFFWEILQHFLMFVTVVNSLLSNRSAIFTLIYKEEIKKKIL